MSLPFMLSDHFLISINVSLQKQSFSAKVNLYRKWKAIKKDEIIIFLGICVLALDPPDNIG